MAEEVKRDLFETGVEQQSEILVLSLEKAKILFQTREKTKEWVKDFIRKGFTTIEIAQVLKFHNYDFENAGSALERTYQTKKTSKEAMQGVEQIKEQKQKEDLMKKRTSQVTWITSAFVFGGVGLFMALILDSQNKELANTGIDLGMAGGMMDGLVKGSWILAIAGGFVGLFLLILTLSSYFKERAKKKNMTQAEIEAKTKEIQEKMEMKKPAQGTATEQQTNQTQQPITKQQVQPATSKQPVQKAI
ncbi:MAG: hypothetical protein KKA65_00590 [Nanoarchaeota archaeon]|nr:hypothetical protein [Nanoarchaeota archaeon]MBU4352384.1 hypothetical protein [Nanoarchaeota archaeon]MBU4455976.1 hypothetical protein [Nanoarchaeota archaeon]MCG2719366.1 hypothetical protein [Nanoarchaeota archaeon]